MQKSSDSEIYLGNTTGQKHTSSVSNPVIILTILNTINVMVYIWSNIYIWNYFLFILAHLRAQLI